MSSSIGSLGKSISSVILKDKSKIHKLISNYNGIDWVRYANYHNDVLFYKRQVYIDDNIDIYVVSWNRHYINKIHDHAPGGCWMRIMDGLVLEKKYNPTTLSHKKQTFLPKGNVGYIDNSTGYHSIQNRGENNAITLNVYNPPNYTSNTFTKRENVFDDME